MAPQTPRRFDFEAGTGIILIAITDSTGGAHSVRLDRAVDDFQRRLLPYQWKDRCDVLRVGPTTTRTGIRRAVKDRWQLSTGPKVLLVMGHGYKNPVFPRVQFNSDGHHFCLKYLHQMFREEPRPSFVLDFCHSFSYVKEARSSGFEGVVISSQQRDDVKPDTAFMADCIRVVGEDRCGLAFVLDGRSDRGNVLRPTIHKRGWYGRLKRRKPLEEWPARGARKLKRTK